jgi:hypothetical protein
MPFYAKPDRHAIPSLAFGVRLLFEPQSCFYFVLLYCNTAVALIGCCCVYSQPLTPFEFGDTFRA